MIVWFTAVDGMCGPTCKSLEEAFEFLKQFESECKSVSVEKGEMAKKAYESLPEFEGF